VRAALRHLAPLLAALVGGCSSTYVVPAMEIRRHARELREHGAAEIVDRSGDTLTLTLDDETMWGESVRRLLRHCSDAPRLRWGRDMDDDGPAPDRGCALAGSRSVTIERTDWLGTIVSSTLSLGAVGTIIGCGIACENDTLATASQITIVLLPLLAIRPLWIVLSNPNAGNPFVAGH
jgi:hypothetical protein